jgi:acyl-CoA dehydrogenase
MLKIFAPLIKTMQHKLPTISSTEQEALDAGTVWWDGQLFSGKPDWKMLLDMPTPQLTAEEQAFMDGPVTELCRMIDTWQINFIDKDLPPDMWRFIKENKFFGLMIPKSYGGLEFSFLAHSEILTKIAGKCATVASTVSVPNSLGPAELLLNYGTQQQKDKYLRNLAEGKEIPCFALTAPEAGSDATAIIDNGIVCYQEFAGQKTLGVLLNWNKRYITLAPIATVMGLAFKLFDPQNILNKGTNVGITCALIPTNHPGITIGDRHWPLTTMFQNGPIQGKDVFIPIDWIIGGVEMAGKGWTMLVESLSCGRAISLPSVAGKAKVLAAASGAYTRIRQQFNQPICNFEGVAEPLARIAGNTYIVNATRKLTAASIDNGAKPTVPGAISKCHVTERARLACIDAMDIHGGKAIMQGRKNYISNGYMSAPIAITVEGANILTRNLIIFGQGAIRCHPFIMREMQALKNPDINQATSNFIKLLLEHFVYSCRNLLRAFFGYLTHGIIFKSPVADNNTAKYYRWITWASSAFAVLADTSLISIGGKLKYKENLSARLGDLLAQLYMASMVLKRYKDEGSPIEDLPIVEWSIRDLLAKFWETVKDILHNYPNRYLAFMLRCYVMPFGIPIAKPKDELSTKIAQMLTYPNPSRDRLIKDSYLEANDLNPAGELEHALQIVLAAADLEKRLSKAQRDGQITALIPAEQVEQAKELKIINASEANLILKAQIARAAVIAVDFFKASEMAP